MGVGGGWVGVFIFLRFNCGNNFEKVGIIPGGLHGFIAGMIFGFGSRSTAGVHGVGGLGFVFFRLIAELQGG